LSIASTRLWFSLALAIVPLVEAQATTTDAEFAKLFVGTWRSTSSKEGSNAAFASITYVADGSFKMILYDESCKGIRHEAAGTWQIKDKVLHTKTTRSVGSQQRLRAGTITKDKVISVEGDKMVLRSVAGGLLYRTKGEPCAQK